MADIPTGFERMLGQAAGRIDPQWSAERTESALVGLQRRRTRRAVVRAGAGALVLLAAAAWGSQRFGDTALGADPVAEVAPSIAADHDNGPATARGDETRSAVKPISTPLALSDGTRVVPVDDGARVAELEPPTADAQAVRVQVVEGRSRFDRTQVAGTRQMELEAGPVRVHVFASRFSAARYEAEVELWVEDGYLEVTTETGTRRIDAGEHERFSLTDRQAASDLEAEAGLATEATVPGVADGDTSRERTAGRTRRDRKIAARRNADAEPVSSDEVNGLLERADQERRAGRPAAAANLLRQIVRQHRADARAPLAGFTLGRVLLDDLGKTKAAARAFDRARAMDPSGPLAEDALARAAEAWHQAGDADKARDRAEAYLERYPDGHRARAVRQYSTR